MNGGPPLNPYRAPRTFGGRTAMGQKRTRAVQLLRQTGSPMVVEKILFEPRLTVKCKSPLFYRGLFA